MDSLPNLQKSFVPVPHQVAGQAAKAGAEGRQMLFSATISDEVDKLVQLSMHRPIRLFVDPKKSLARGLMQEFVRVKRENERI
jgi:ATP-dependent RNA helicase DDX27